MRVLVCDDDQVCRDYVEALFGAVGIRVDHAADAVSAVNAVRLHAYVLVLMDVRMPEFSGLKAVKWIRSLPGRPGRVPIIAITGHVAAEYQSRCLEAGMDGFLEKPFRRHDLVRVIRDVTGRYDR